MTPSQTRALLAVIEDRGSLSVWRHDSNVYSVNVDFDRGLASIEDDLDTSSDGSTELTLDELAALLRDHIRREASISPR